MNNDLTRDVLIAICERAFVPESAWHDRDSADAQRQLGEAYALLRAGCDFTIRDDMDSDPTRTIWVRIYSRGFSAFEWGDEREHYDEETYYLPTDKRLAQAGGRDWY